MELSDYIRVLRKNWLVIVAITLIGLGAAAGYSLTRTPMYQAEATVFVSTQQGNTVQELQQGNTFTQARVTTYTSLVTQQAVLEKTVQKLGLNESADQLAKNVSASNTLNTTLIRITATDPSPTQAAAIANAVSQSLTETVPEIEPSTTTGESPVKLTTTTTATAPLAPVSPNVPLNLALGGLIGLVLGIAFAVLRHVLDTKVRSIRDVESVTDRPIIGAIPFDPKAAERPIILQADPHNARSESFRALRTNLQFLEMDGGHVFVVTSSLPSEGKSTTSVNLAIALADAGKRVALVDTDLRKPKVAEYLAIEGGAGLTDVLIGRARLTDVMLPWGQRSLYALPAGKVPPNPSELLGSAQMSQLLDVLSREFDIVILDAPPLLPVTDAAVLSKVATGALVVVAAGRTSKGQVSAAIDALDTVGAKIGGMVLSMVPIKGPDAYGYGYGYGYATYGGYSASHSGPASARGRRARKVASPTSDVD